MAFSLLAKKRDEEREKEAPLPLLSLLTFSPLGNPAAGISALQRQQLLAELLRRADEQRSGQMLRARQLAGSFLPASAVPRRAEAGTSQQAQERKAAEGENIAQVRRAKAIAKQERGEEGAEGEKITASLPKYRKVASAQAAEGKVSLEQAQEELSFVLNDYARGDAAKAQAAASEFSSRLRSEEFKADDLMAVLLLVIEDLHYEGEEGAEGSARHFGARIPASGQQAVPEKLREAAKEAAVVRLASVREMLRYYFERHPKEYASTLATALGLTSDQGEDAELLQERLAAELAHVGCFALAQKILAALKKKKKAEQDAEKCLLELGYKYDKKTRKLIVGKRTCLTAREAQELLRLLLSLRKG